MGNLAPSPTATHIGVDRAILRGERVKFALLGEGDELRTSRIPPTVGKLGSWEIRGSKNMNKTRVARSILRVLNDAHAPINRQEIARAMGKRW